MASLKIDNAIRILPDVNYNRAEALRQAGFSKASSRAGTTYATLRKRLDLYYNPEAIKRDILKAEEDFAKAGDNSNRARMLELRCKILGLSRDNNVQTAVINVNDTISKLKIEPSVDASTSQTVT
uniref:Uncharacterized protein n=1 Tax=viral metagenome TaxID=1070528 RepID=A0A6M3IYB8_9ZZZZ